MSSVEQPPSGLPPETSAPPPAPPAEQGRGHSRWLWAALALGVACVGLFAWGASKSSDLSDAQDSNATSNAVMSNAYQDVNETLGVTSEQLDQANGDVQKAEQAAKQAEQDAADAEQKAAAASDGKAKAQADADKAEAEVAAAESKVQVATDCAKAYASAVGTLFDGEDVKAQATKVRQQLTSITEDCKAALNGA